MGDSTLTTIETLCHRISGYEDQLNVLAELEAELDRAFAHLVSDNAQFEVQLTHYFESRGSLLHQKSPQSGNSDDSGDDDGDDDVSDSGDDDSGLGTDEARTDGGVGGDFAVGRPPGCDASVFALVTVFRDLRWSVRGWIDGCKRERGAEERRHAAVMRRLQRAAHATHTALQALTSLQSEREAELGLIATVLWLRRSQSHGADLAPLTILPIPNTEDENVSCVIWPRNITSLPTATLLPQVDLDLLQHRVTQAKFAQQLAAKRRREGRAERSALIQEVEELHTQLSTLRHSYQVTKECKLGPGCDADLGAVAGQLASSLDLRWPSKVSSQVTRHNTTMIRLQGEVKSHTREVRALQREETALSAHVLSLRQEKDHLLYHLTHTHAQVIQDAGGVGSNEEVRQLKATVARHHHIITSLKREIGTLRCKTGSVTLPGASPIPRTSPYSPSLPHSIPTWSQHQEHQSQQISSREQRESHKEESWRDHSGADDEDTTSNSEVSIASTSPSD